MKLAPILFFLISVGSHAQELNCRVIVNAQQIQTTEREIFETMEKEFALFMNTTKWTNNTFKEEETIKCNILINITAMPSIGIFESKVQVLSSRPVFGTGYETVVLNYGDDKFNFEYVAGQPLFFNENTFTNEITSLLAYYALVIIGFDHDTFADLGGNPYFDKAFNIVNNAQSSGNPGWGQFGQNRNRYWLIENIRSPQLQPIRKALYKYHIEGLDMMAEKKEESEKNILKALSDIKQSNNARPNSILKIVFIDAKGPEISKMFLQSSLPTRREAYNLLTVINPAQTDEYKKLLE